MKFIKWFKKFDVKRRWMLIFIFLYAVIGTLCAVLPYFYPNQRMLFFLGYGIVSIPFVISSIVVVISDQKEFERSLFKEKK